MRIDIIFSDLDGTLLLGDKGLSPGRGGGPGPGGGAGDFLRARHRAFFQRHSPGGAGAALLAVRHCDERGGGVGPGGGEGHPPGGAVPGAWPSG